MAAYPLRESSLSSRTRRANFAVSIGLPAGWRLSTLHYQQSRHPGCQATAAALAIWSKVE
jgi:hypothetical protein